MTQICSVEGCSGKRHARGLCNLHYKRMIVKGEVGDASSLATPRGAPLRFLCGHVSHRGDECLIWPFSKNSHGYAWIAAKYTGASRMMCAMAHGEPPSLAHQAAHSCGNGHLGCVNPAHLRWALPTENNADKVAHGTVNRGELNGASILTKEDILFIRASRGRVSGKTLAVQFGVAPTTISAIQKKTRWAWL